MLRTRYAGRAQLHAGTWYHVADGATLDKLKANIPANYQQIPVGKRTRIVLNTSPFPVAPIFDLAGAEFAARLLQHGGKLIDVSGSGAFNIIFEIEAVETASASGYNDEGASMAMPAVVLWIGVIAGILVLLPIILRLATMLANFVPGGDSGGGGIMDYLKTLFGDYYWVVLAGGAFVLVYVMTSRRGSSSAPVIYNIEGSYKRASKGRS